MRNLYSLIWMLLLPFLAVAQQYTVVGSATPAAPASANATCFNLTPALPSQRGAVWNTTPINLNSSFELNTSMYFGALDPGADGMAFVLQNEGQTYIGNEGAGLGYHRFAWDVPGPVPSFIVEFDTYENGFVIMDNIGDPAADHLGFMSNSNAYHTSPTALAPPVSFSTNIEDGQWHDVRFTWNATTKTMTVVVTLSTTPLTTQTFTYTGDIVNTIFGGNPNVFWGFTAATGGAGGSGTAAPGNEHKVCIKPNTPPCVDDNEKPVLICPPTVVKCYESDCYYQIPQLVATDNCGIDWIKYIITGATWRVGVGKNASGSFNKGTSTITWIVRDKKGNTATCTTTVIIKKVSVDIPDAYAVHPGGKPFTIYKGYGSQSITLTANPSGGTAPYTYLWSNGAITQSTTVSPSAVGTHSYWVKVTDANGCVGYETIKVKVKDVRKQNKVVICHIPPGNPCNKLEITVAASAVPEQLAHGDYLGECQGGGKHDDDDDGRSHDDDDDDGKGHHDDDDDDGKGHHDGDDDDGRGKGHHRGAPTTVKPGMETAVSDFLVVPNPTDGRFELRLTSEMGNTAQIVITDANGAIVENRTVKLISKGQSVRFDLTRQTAGIYFIKLVTRQGVQMRKVVIQR